VDDPVAELAGYFQRKTKVPDADLVGLTSAARAAGRSWSGIAAECGVWTRADTYGVITQPGRIGAETTAALLFLGTQHALEQVTGSRRYPPLVWPCPGCGQQVTDRAATGRPHHIEHGHRLPCTRLSRDQAADADARRTQIPRLIAVPEPAAGPLQRHRLRERIIDDCPRCGWHGYFHTHLAIIDGDWSTAVCDNCYADLHPAITVTVKYFSVRSPSSGGPVAVIRERTRSDYRYPDLGEEMTWRLQWQHTTLLAADA
jgi:hypothetical protein